MVDLEPTNRLFTRVFVPTLQMWLFLKIRNLTIYQVQVIKFKCWVIAGHGFYVPCGSVSNHSLKLDTKKVDLQLQCLVLIGGRHLQNKKEDAAEA